MVVILRDSLLLLGSGVGLEAASTCVLRMTEFSHSTNGR